MDYKLGVQMVDITPQEAKEMLEGCNIGNRKIKKYTVDQYAYEMKAGEWKQNGESIVFSDRGVLKDGQHRLLAVVKSGVTLKNQVVAVVKDEQANYYDNGVARTLNDVLHFAGYDEPYMRNLAIQGTINMGVKRKLKCTKPPKSLTIEQMIKHKEAGMFIYDNILKRDAKLLAGVKKSGLLLTVLNAYECGVAHDTLCRFCNVLVTGISTVPEDVMLIRFRDYLKDVSYGRGGTRSQEDDYYRSQKILHYYEQGKILHKYVETKEEFYEFKML